MSNTKTIEELEAMIEALEKELAYYRATYPGLCKKKSLSEIAIENLPFDVFAID
jgi:hypothetical protein